jgi:hypothetical protein
MQPITEEKRTELRKKKEEKKRKAEERAADPSSKSKSLPIYLLLISIQWAPWTCMALLYLRVDY